MPLLNTFLLTLAIVIAAKTGAWLLQLRTRNAGLVDAIWAWTLGLLAVIYALGGRAPVNARIVLALMGGLWGLRLGVHLWRRNSGRPEDWRYAKFRKEWGRRANFNMFWLFQFQNVFTLLLSASAYGAAAYRTTAPAHACVILALAIWLVSVLGETLADAQMAEFRRNPANKGRVCREGFWRYSRHPNYFFECLHWLAYLPLALGAPWGWTVLIAPVVMAFLLLKLSGMPLLEAEMMRRKPGYAEYVRNTSALIPWFPKNS
ncbi:MAG: DUF1295 domain-containing protein [Stenotrophobium sp.]